MITEQVYQYGITDEQWRQLCAFFEGCCPKCGQEADLTVDHIIPTSKGGKYFDIANMQPLCQFCNKRKGNREEIDYRPPHVREWAKQESEAQGSIRDAEMPSSWKRKASVSLSEEETMKLNAMAAEDERSRSALLGRLIRQEWERRQAKAEEAGGG